MPLLVPRRRLVASVFRHPVRAAEVGLSRVRLRGRAWTPAGSRALIDSVDATGSVGRHGHVEPTADRVLHVVTNALPTVQAGYTLRTHGVVRAQREGGLDAHVVTRWGWPVEQGVLDAPALVEVDGVPYHRLLPHGLLPHDPAKRARKGADALERLVRELRPSLLHAATDHPNGAAALAAARTCGLPFVYEMRGLVEESRAARGEGDVDTDARAVETSLLTHADAVLVLGAAMRDEMVGRGVPVDKVFVVPNAVDAALLTARPDGVGFRAAYGIGATEHVVGSVSGLHVYEGFDVLLHAAARLRVDGHSVRVVLVGDGPARRQLEALAAELDLEDVVFTGRVPHAQAAAAFAALDVMAVPRTDHRVCRLVTPLKPLEAMALGVPVVASDLPALRELTDDGRAGVHVPPGDADALAEALLDLLGDPARAAALAAAARAHTERRHTWSQTAAATRVAYASVNRPD